MKDEKKVLKRTVNLKVSDELYEKVKEDALSVGRNVHNFLNVLLCEKYGIDVKYVYNKKKK